MEDVGATQGDVKAEDCGARGFCQQRRTSLGHKTRAPRTINRERSGAHTAVQAVKPDLGISLEVGVAGDHPGGRPEASQEKLGAGPVLYLADGAMLVNLHLRDFFERLAEANHIPYQTEVTTGSAEDSAEMQRFGSGIPSLNYAVATRYLHTHSSELDRADLDHAIDLLVKALNALDAKTLEEIARF